jgi:hypothetical protein
LRGCHTTLDQDSSLIAVVEMSQSSWLVAGIVPGISRQPAKKLKPDQTALLGLLRRWQDEAAKAGRRISRLAVAFEAGRDGFWLARWLRARGIEAYVIHATSIAVSREHRRAKTDPLLARLMAHQICHWGENLAAEINEGRKVRASIDKMADARGRSTLVMSRRAKNFRDQCRSVEARDLIDGAIKKANLSLTAVEFNKLVELACERDETSCRDLGRLSEQLAPHLPDKRGRPISAETCIHFFLLRWLESSGNQCAYTSSTDNAGFTDPVTRATQLALGNGGFSPLYAYKLHKKPEIKTAARVAALVFESNLARVDRPANMETYIRQHVYKPEYQTFV